MTVLAGLECEVRPAARAPEGALVLLHGAGATEQDPMALLPVLDPGARLIGAAPRGTMRLRSSPGYQWFVDREPGYPQRDTFEQTAEILTAWLGALAEATGVPPERTIIGGMSQGATVAWGLTLGAGRPQPGGLLAISGFIPRVNDFELDDARLAGLPVAICHGERDQRVPVDFARSARDRAVAAGADVLYRETDVPHILDPRVVPELIAWIATRP